MGGGHEQVFYRVLLAHRGSPPAAAPAVDLESGFQVWWLLNELCLLGVCLVLARWWRPL